MSFARHAACKFFLLQMHAADKGALTFLGVQVFATYSALSHPLIQIAPAPFKIAFS